MKKYFLRLLYFLILASFLYVIAFFVFSGYVSQFFYPNSEVADYDVVFAKSQITSGYRDDSSYNILELLSVENGLEQRIDLDVYNEESAFGSFGDALILNDKVYVVVNYRGNGVKETYIYQYDLNTKSRKVVDYFDHSSNPAYRGAGSILLLSVDGEHISAFLTGYGKLRTYSSDINNYTETNFWDVVYDPKGYGPRVGHRIDPTNDGYDLKGGTVTNVVVDNGKIHFFIASVFSPEPNKFGVQGTRICYPEMRKFTWISTYDSALLSCDVGVDWSCEITCLEKDLFEDLSDTSESDSMNRFAMYKTNYFIVPSLKENLYELDLGYILPTWSTSLSPITKITPEGSSPLYKMLISDLNNTQDMWSNRIEISERADYIIFTYGDFGLSKWDSYLLETDGKSKPILVGENRFPLYAR